MKKHTDDTVLKKAQTIWPDAAITVRQKGEGWEVTVSAMYEAPGLSFANLCDLAEFFETKAIHDDRFGSEGCETCDYGSEYGFRLRISPEAK
jgi:hypothetical protein